MKRVIKIVLIAVICFTVLFCLTVVSNPDYAVRFGLASGPPGNLSQSTILNLLSKKSLSVAT